MKKRKFIKRNAELIELRKENKQLRDDVENWKKKWFAESKLRRNIESELRLIAGTKLMDSSEPLMTIPYNIERKFFSGL